MEIPGSSIMDIGTTLTFSVIIIKKPNSKDKQKYTSNRAKYFLKNEIELVKQIKISTSNQHSTNNIGHK